MTGVRAMAPRNASEVQQRKARVEIGVAVEFCEEENKGCEMRVRLIYRVRGEQQWRTTENLYCGLWWAEFLGAWDFTAQSTAG
ncbi:hypothetical protein RchiOBHm_Chr7g0205101 [Rosa chinensis]|uniref:Uncharacterized protein n=1 Tax=Rosa chinensis TaxID=74649 RepID=A0A2P6P8U9_ROSCH|nr:hypothetical protein RchiOBHm_Chr7g0205101 [Rosa chinensis]